MNDKHVFLLPFGVEDNLTRSDSSFFSTTIFEGCLFRNIYSAHIMSFYFVITKNLMICSSVPSSLIRKKSAKKSSFIYRKRLDK